MRNRRPLALTSFAAALVLLAAGCGSHTYGSASGSAATPSYGGALKLVGSSDVDHLDTASAYYTVSYTLERAFTRQLFSYPASTDIGTANTPVADVATEVPTGANGGISADGKTWTVHLRSGVRWNTTPAREVTAKDFVLGLKRLCNPVSPVGAPGYYENTIVGMRGYCDGFAKVGQDVASIRSYIESHDVAGLRATNDKTLVIQLLRPASDVTNILAMPFASAAPWSTWRTCPTATPSASTPSPTAPTRSSATRRASRSPSARTPPGSRPATRSGTSTSTRSRSPRARTRVRCSSRSRPAPPATSRCPRTPSDGPSTSSCRGSRWPSSPRPPTRGSSAAPCWRCLARTTSAPRGPKASPNRGWCTGTVSAAPSPRWVTQLGIDLGTLLGGVIVTEQVFGLPGLGQLAWQSVTTQDLPVIIGTVLVASLFIVVANILVDLSYAILDPRVRPA